MSIEGEPILVVDDEETVREVISERLSEAGYHCTCVGNAAEALRALRETTFSLALLDIRMPGTSGIELLREVRIAYPDTHAIMVTAMDDAGTAVQAMRLGASDYIVKPLNLDALLVATERALETRRIILENREYRLRLEERVKEQMHKVREKCIESLQPIATGLEDRDPYWCGDSQRVLRVAEAVAGELSLRPDALEKIRLGVQFHNLGKAGVAERVLHKPGPLSAEEYGQVMQHTVFAEGLLKCLIDDVDVMAIVKYHHERWNGEGSPHGLKGVQIPIPVRVVALANAYVAMISPRSYRPALTPEEAKKEILDASGVVFDPQIVAAFMRLGSGELTGDAGKRGLHEL